MLQLCAQLYIRALHIYTVCVCVFLYFFAYLKFFVFGNIKYIANYDLNAMQLGPAASDDRHRGLGPLHGGQCPVLRAE
jgi:hypothetical protein